MALGEAKTLLNLVDLDLFSRPLEVIMTRSHYLHLFCIKISLQTGVLIQWYYIFRLTLGGTRTLLNFVDLDLFSLWPKLIVTKAHYDFASHYQTDGGEVCWRSLNALLWIVWKYWRKNKFIFCWCSMKFPTHKKSLTLTFVVILNFDPK